jgi:hypothetical protein
MLEIKGSVLKDVIKSTKKAIGESNYNRLLDLCNPETKDLFLRPISTSGWYPLDAYTNFLDVVVSELFGGRPEGLIKSTEAIAERQLRGLYSSLVKVDSPEFLWKKVGMLNSTYFRGVRLESSVSGEGKGKLRYVGLEKQHASLEPIFIGFSNKAAEIYGAKNVRLAVTTPIAAGKGYMEMDISWDQK